MDTGTAALSAAALGTTTGAAALNPLRQYSKMTPRAHALTSNESYRSLTSVECKALQFPQRERKLQAFAAAQAIGFTADRWTYSLTIKLCNNHMQDWQNRANKKTNTGKKEGVRATDWCVWNEYMDVLTELML